VDQPDFAVRPGGAPDLLAPFGSGPWTVLPSALRLATGTDGGARLLLELVRVDPPVPGHEDGYAVLDLHLEADCRLRDALREARTVDPAATVVPAALGRGWLRFEAPLDVDVPAELTQPVALGYRGLAEVRWTLRLTPAGGALVREALVEGALVLRAVALFEVAGIAPRLPMRVRAAGADVAAGLAALAGADGNAPRDDVLAALRRDPSTLGFELLADGTPPKPELVAEVLCDVLARGFATLQPGPGGPVLVPAAAASSSDLDRDLREPLATTRPLTLNLDPLAAARAAAAGASPEALVRETVVPRFNGGLRTLRVMANLPSERVGLVALGARVAKAPAPPDRVQAVAAEVAIAEPSDEGATTVRLAPREAPVVDVEPFAVVQVGRKVRRLAGPVRQEDGSIALLAADDFPVRFVRVCAEAALLALADVAGRCRFRWMGDGAELPIALSAADPHCSLALPVDAGDAELSLELRSVDGPGTLALEPRPAADLVVSLASVPEYGPQSVRASCRFADGSTLYAVDILPEAAPDDRRPQVLTFTPTRPERTVSWFAASPFRSGLRYRPHPARGAPAAPWSQPHPRSTPLELVAEATG
jgi:hypothetical protein